MSHFWYRLPFRVAVLVAILVAACGAEARPWPVRFAVGVGHTASYCGRSVTGAVQCAFVIGGSALDMYAGHQDAKAGYRELNVLHPNYTMPPLTLLHIYSISKSGPKGSWISTGFAGVHYWAGWHDLRTLPR